MKEWTLIIKVQGRDGCSRNLESWLRTETVDRVVAVGETGGEAGSEMHVEHVEHLGGGELQRVLEEARTPFLAVITEAGEVVVDDLFFYRIRQLAGDERLGLLYCHFHEYSQDGGRKAVILPPQLTGSARDSFPMGPMVILNRDRVMRSLAEDGPLKATRWSGLEEIRLRLARRGEIVHVPEFMYEFRPDTVVAGEEQHFAYVLQEARQRQIELEQLFTRHLRLIDAWLPAPGGVFGGGKGSDFPVMASIIIPVRDRANTVADALNSALDQRVSFDYNVIVVDNFSTDGTSEVIEEAADRHSRIVHLRPPRRGRGIGGCWQLALQSEACGRFSVQLDSDDLYESDDTLQLMVDCLRDGPHALAVGSYRIVDESLNEIPPGVIDHREWTPENGHNNLLRVEGIGAPRAYDTAMARTVGFPDVSYGEDYAMALALSRQYSVGRLFESVYLCRRWSGNTDSALPPDRVAANHYYKDFLRTREIALRQEMNSKK